MPIQLTTNGTEEGTYVVTAAFTDEDGDAVVPNNIHWWLYDSDRSIVNSRSNVNIAVPAASVDIVLQGDDLAIIGTDNRRIMRVEYDYDSSYGSSLPGKKEVEFSITNLETYVGTLEDTLTLTVSTNTWCTMAQADAYLEGKWGASGWAILPIESRKQLLISAYNWISRLPNYSIGSVTAQLRNAQIELAWYIYNNSDSHEKHEALEAQGVDEFRISKFHEKLSGTKLPKIVEDLLSDYDLYSGGYLPTIEREVEENY